MNSVDLGRAKVGSSYGAGIKQVLERKVYVDDNAPFGDAGFYLFVAISSWRRFLRLNKIAFVNFGIKLHYSFLQQKNSSPVFQTNTKFFIPVV